MAKSIFLFWKFLAASAICWSLSNFGTFVQESHANYIADRIKRTEPYKAQVVKDLVEVASGGTPEMLQANAIIAERLLELDLMSSKRTAIDGDIEKTQSLVVRALKTNPCDSFLWLSLYWLRTIEGGFSQKNIPLLDMSYATGGNEGWIALRRNRLAFIVYTFLPPNVAAKANEEFRSLVASRFTQAAADIIAGPAWAERDELLSSLDLVPISERQRLAKQLYDMGYALDVPGVVRSNARPWRQYNAD